MKKFALLAMLIMGCAAIADNVDINGEFKKVGKTMPNGWIQNKGKWAEPFGVIKLLKLTEKDGDTENAIQITSTTVRTEIYTTAKATTKAGDVFELKVDAKGTGTLIYGIYVYTDKGAWISSVRQTAKVTGDFQEYKASITVKDHPKRGNAGIVRIFIGADANSDIVVKEVEADQKAKQ